jgi:hypothetical protein
MKINRSASVYFALQSIAVAAWWILLFFVPTLRVHFQMGDSETILLAFWLPDLFLLILGSLAASVFCFLVINLLRLPRGLSSARLVMPRCIAWLLRFCQIRAGSALL